MATLDQLRALFPNASSDADLINKASKEFGISASEIADEVGYDTPKGGITKNQASSSIDRYQAGLYGVGEAVAKGIGAKRLGGWLQEQREDNELRADLASERAHDLGAVDRWADVHGLADFGSYVKGLGIQSAPYMAEALAGGALGRAAMSGTRAALTAAREAGDLAAVARAERALKYGSDAGVVAASYPSAVGDVLSNQREQNGKTNLGAAAALGIPYAALNILGVEGALGEGKLFRNPINMLDNVSGVKGGLARAGASAAVTGFSEGIGETGQEILNQAGRIAVDPTATFTSPDAMERYKESFIGGSLLAGSTAATMGGWRRSENAKQPTDSVGQAIQSENQTTMPPVQPPAAPPVIPVGQLTNQQPAPVVQGGTTDVATASAAANQQQQIQNQIEQAKQATAAAMTEFGIADPAKPQQGNLFGKPLFGPAVTDAASAMAQATQQFDPFQKQLIQAVATANAQTGGKLISYTFNANDVKKSVQKAMEGVAKTLTKFQIGHAKTAEEAGQILDTLSQQAKGDQLEQINAIHFALTGKDTSGYQAAQVSNKGAKNDNVQLQQQDNAGVGTVREQSPAGEAGSGNAGAVQPSGVQPIGTGSEPQGQVGQQAGQLPGEGVRVGTSDSATVGDGNAQAPQVTPTQELLNDQGQQTPSQTTGAAIQAAPEVSSTTEDTTQRRADEDTGNVPASLEEHEGSVEAKLDIVPTLLRRVLGMMYKSQAKIEFLATFVRKGSESYAEVGKRLGLSENTIKDYQKLLKVDEATGLPKFIAQDLVKFQQALKVQAELMNVSVDELKAALQEVYDVYESAGSDQAVDESDLVANDLAIQNREERTDKNGKGTGKSDLTNVTNIVDETDYRDRANEAYMAELDAYAEDPSEENKAKLDAAERAASAKNNGQAQKLYKAYQKIKEGKDAVQEQSTGEVDVQPEASNGQEVGEGNTKPEEPAGESKGALTVQTPQEQYKTLTDGFPVPAFAELPQSQQNQIVDLAHRDQLNLAAINRILTSQPKQLTKEPVTIDVEARVIDETVGKQVAALPEPQVTRLERHYNLKRDSAEFLAKVKEDVVKYATQGAEAVAAAIRDVIKAIHSGVLAMAIIFNPTGITSPEAFVLIQPQTTTIERVVQAEVPAELQSKMSPAAQEAYKSLVPALKEQLTKENKLLIVADKPGGRIFVFKPDGSLVLEKKSLFGAAKGDLYVGNNDLPKNRITPAGLHNIKLVDAKQGGAAAKTAGEYDFGKVFGIVDSNPGVLTIMHSVWLHEKDAPQRAAALKNENAADSRYSFGCINVDKTTYKFLLDNYEQQMDGSKLFVVPDAQNKVQEFLTGDIAKNKVQADSLERQSITPVTEKVTTTTGNATKVAQTDRTQVGKEEETRTQQSRASEEADETYTKEDLTDSIKDFVNRESLSDTVNVVDDLEDIRSLPEFNDMSDAEFAKFLEDEGIDGGTQAFVSSKTGKAYMLASNIEVGTGRGVFLHEIGGHLGLQKYLSGAAFLRLGDRVIEWAKRGDDSIECKLAQAAISRVLEAGVTGNLSRRQEMVAYFLEEAVNSGINPQAYEKIGSSGLREWMRSLWALFKNALRMMRGINADKMTAQDLVDLAYGYAQLEVGGRFHGTNNSFRKFQLSYMGTGVGNQQYGWGLYFAELRKTAEGYAVPDTDAPADAKSYLHTIDIAVRDDELIDWNKSIGDQSAKVRALAAKLNIKGMVRGEDLYKGLGEALYENDTGKPVTDKTSRGIAYELASKFLEQIGIKGIKYRDGNDSNRVASNLVIFNDRNVIRIKTEEGTATDRQAVNPEFEWHRTQQSRAPKGLRPSNEEVAAALAGFARNRKTGLEKGLESMLLPLAITQDLVKYAGKYMRSAGRYLDAQMARMTTRLQFENRIESIVSAFNKLDDATQKLVNDYIHDSTVEGKWGYYPGEHRVSTRLFTIDPDMEKRYEAIKKQNPAAAKVIRDVFEHGYQALKTKKQAVQAAIQREFDERERAAMGDPEILAELAKEKKRFLELEKRLFDIPIDTPYAYLGRYGNFVVVAKSAEFKHWEERAKLNDFDVEQAKGWLAKHTSDPDHYVVQFAETQQEADKIAADLMATGNYDITPDDAGPKEHVATYTGDHDVFMAVARLRNMVRRDKGEGDEAAEKVDQMIGDLYLMAAAQSSARRSFLQRKNVAGADRNMMRNLSTSGRADAHFLSSLQHADEINDALEAMRDEARNNRREAMPVYNELVERHVGSMNYAQAHVLSQAMSRLTSTYFLATSPAFYLQQMLQTMALSIPHIASRMGYFRSWRAVMGAYNDVMPLVKGLDITDHVDFNKAPADVRTMLQTLVGWGKIDIAIDADARVHAGENGPLNKVLHKLQGVNTRIETINRATAAIAAYRSYLQKYGADKTAAATKYAAEVVSESHGSYDGFNTPRLLQGNLGRVVGQFKRFQIIQLSMLAKLIHTSFKGASAEEKLIARKTLGFIAGHMAVLGGALGVPFVSQLAWILTKLLGDPDEPDDVEYQLRQAIGDKDLADLLLRGVPAFLGAESLGKKLAMEKVSSPMPLGDFDLTSRSGAEKTLVGLLGPSVSLGLNFIDAGTLMAKGDIYKGMEKALPSGIANAMKGYRFATEGVTMRNGDVVMNAEDISLFTAAFQAIGLPTNTITDRQRLQGWKAEFDDFYNTKTTEIKEKYVKAAKNGDSEGRADAVEEWNQLQQARMSNGYKRQPLSDLFKAPQAAAKRLRDIKGGVEFNKNSAKFGEMASGL